MTKQPKLKILRGLLFTYCIENTKDLDREEIIASKNVNDASELSELFDVLTKPEFLSYREDEQQWFINTLEHFLATDENFDSVFYLFDTFFEDEILDKREFMTILLSCLLNYKAEATANKSP
ncbi:hypothetical protein BFW87_21860 [Pseudomonas fluorescens]|uniref:CdiI immunity protein domain-containing protein n=1 Tax=Pseudomonas fluorescens TaxID=294 RepID=A0A1T2YDC2_PSEFL|nr:hypothetical protein [Pseudomonas fluorescens]OPA90108.1 hypothetical protein BFW87_21860 [Pseudomonas fluorescens]